jgi:ribosomal protein L25 (general stress protein Ctc)
MPSTTSHARPTLAALPRAIVGKHVARLRRAGQLPAVVYGHGVASTSVTIDAHDFELLRRKTGPNALVDLSVDGKKADPVLIHDVQVHPVTHRPLHVDLFLVRMTEELTVDRDRERRWNAPPRDRVGQDQGPAGSPAAVDRVFDREPPRLRRCDSRSRSHDPVRCDTPDRRRRDRRQGPGAARRGRGADRCRGRGCRGRGGRRRGGGRGRSRGRGRIRGRLGKLNRGRRQRRSVNPASPASISSIRLPNGSSV